MEMVVVLDPINAIVIRISLDPPVRFQCVSERMPQIQQFVHHLVVADGLIPVFVSIHSISEVNVNHLIIVLVL